MRWAFAICVLACLGFSSGCSMCCHPYDECYNCFGGAVPRCNQCCGRVASVFDPAECREEAVYAEGDMEAAPEMAPPSGPPMRPYVESQRMRPMPRQSVLK